MKILITGNNGFIGKNLTYFLSKHHQVFGYEWDEMLLPNINGFDWVIHLGAISSTTERNLDKIMTQNYEFSKWLYNECSKNNVNFQYASSASVYGSNTDFKEDSPKQPQSPYAWSKFLFDRWVWKRQHNIVVQGFRYFNVYGDHEDHKNDQASPVTKFINQAIEKRSISLFCNSDKYFRDFICVNDICKVHNALLYKNKNDLYNIGTGKSVSFQHVADVVAKKYNARIKYVDMPEKLKGQYQEYTCADISKIKKITDIKFTTIEEYINEKKY
jgi:ADP-L-glycero-D-manno-heptose 6-epimerase